MPPLNSSHWQRKGMVFELEDRNQLGGLARSCLNMPLAGPHMGRCSPALQERWDLDQHKIHSRYKSRRGRWLFWVRYLVDQMDHRRSDRLESEIGLPRHQIHGVEGNRSASVIRKSFLEAEWMTYCAGWQIM